MGLLTAHWSKGTSCFNHTPQLQAQFSIMSMKLLMISDLPEELASIKHLKIWFCKHVLWFTVECIFQASCQMFIMISGR